MKALRAAWVLFAAGSAVAGVAIFARELGVDPSPGWGRVRIAMLASGACLAIAGVAWKHLGAAASSTAGRIAAGLEGRFPGVLESGRRWAHCLKQAGREYWPAAPLIVLVLAAYVWFVSSGTWTTLDSPTRYYADLARGFARGNLHLPIRPEASLLLVPNPYEPSPTGAPPGPLDLSYYGGRFYLYWGPVPALILLALRPFVPGRVGDLQLGLLFAAGTYILLSALFLTAWKRWFSDLPKALLWVCLLAAGLAGPVTFMLNNHQGARVYESAILGGQFFLLAGYLAALNAVRGRRFAGRLLCAGGLWGLAVGTRLNLVIPVMVFTVLTVVWMWTRFQRRRERLLAALAISAPLMLAAACLGWYNWARFGSVVQTGQIYQLTGIIDLRLHQDELISMLYVPQNIYNYLLNPAAIGSQIPYLHVMPAATGAVLGEYRPPSPYGGQQVTGLLYTVPFAVFGLLLAARFRVLRPRHHGKYRSDAEAGDHALRWLTVTLGSACLSTFASLLGYFWSAMRFLEDFMPMLMLLSSLSFWMGYRELGSRRAARRLLLLIGTLLAAISIINSTLIAISINDARLLISRWLASRF